MAFHFTIPSASIQDTLRYIINFVNRYSTDPFVQQFAQEFHPQGDKRAFVKRVFDYICQNGFYQLDKDGDEEIWTPGLTIRTRNAQGKFQYDCKKITILLGSVLKAAGIDPILKHVYYSDGKGGLENYTHIYIIVPESSLRPWDRATTAEFALHPYITVDPTNGCKWDTEVLHEKGTLYFLDGKTLNAPPKMDLHLMGNNNQRRGNVNPSLLQMFGDSANAMNQDMSRVMGCPPIGCPGDYVGAHYATIGAWSPKDEKKSERIRHVGAVNAFWSQRAAFLALVRLGKMTAKKPLRMHLAKRLLKAYQVNPDAVRKWWWKAGGTADAKSLKKAIMKGTGVSISGPYSYGMDFAFDTDPIYNDGTIGDGGAAEIAALIAAAGTLVIAVTSLFKQLGVKKGDQDIDTEGETPGGGGSPAPDQPGGGTIPLPGGGSITLPGGGQLKPGSFNFISDLCYGNITNALIKSVIVTTAMQMHFDKIMHFIQNLIP